MATQPLTELVVRCFPGETGRSWLYEDDGISRDYLRGDCALTALSYTREGRGLTLEIGAAQGSYRGQVASRSYCIELPGTRRPSAASAGGEPVSVEHDAASATTRLRIAARPVRSPLRVTLSVDSVETPAAR
jgi:hypothetical protein